MPGARRMLAIKLRVHDLAELEDGWIGDGTHCGESLAACGDHPGLLEDGEMFRYILWAGAGGLDELSDVFSTWR